MNMQENVGIENSGKIYFIYFAKNLTKIINNRYWN